MVSLARLLIMGCLALQVCSLSRAAEPAKVDPRVEIARRLNVSSDAVKLTSAGLYEVIQSGEVVYVTADARFAISGQLYDLEHRKNLTRLSVIGGIKDDDTIIFSPKNPRYTVTVFTDVDCQYCRKLHAQIAEYNRRGIRVRYVFYPRSGPGTDSWRKAEAVWCSADRVEALTRAKLGAAMPRSTLCKTHVAQSFEAGNALGMQGTPGIFSERGEYISGYLSPDDLLNRLKDSDGAG
jgi:thiol:disulfide interchange protein DsbC